MKLIISSSFFHGQIASLSQTRLLLWRVFQTFFGVKMVGGPLATHSLEKSDPQGPRNQAKIDLTWISGLSSAPRYQSDWKCLIKPGIAYQGPIFYKMGRGININTKRWPIWPPRHDRSPIARSERRSLFRDRKVIADPQFKNWSQGYRDRENWWSRSCDRAIFGKNKILNCAFYFQL